MRRVTAVVLVVLLVAPRPASAVFGVADTGDGILSSILVENITQTVDMATQIANLEEIIRTARENYEFVRSAYAVAEGLQDFDPNRFLENSRRAFMASNPVFAQGDSLARDISRNGLRGGDPYMIRVLARSELFRSARKMQDCECSFEGNKLVEWKGGDPSCQLTCVTYADQAALFQRQRSAGPVLAPRGYNNDVATRLSAGIETAVNDKDRRNEIIENGATPNASEAVVFYSIAAQDPSAADALLRQRAVAVQAQVSARKDWEVAHKQGNQLNQGTAYAITARSTSLAAEQLAAVREGQAKQIAMQQAQVSSEAAAQQQLSERNELYALHVSEMLFLTVRSLRTPGSSQPPLADAPADPYAP